MRGGKAELLVIDDLVDLYDDSAPQFVGTYKAARNIVDLGTRGGKDKPQELPGS